MDASALTMSDANSSRRRLRTAAARGRIGLGMIALSLAACASTDYSGVADVIVQLDGHVLESGSPKLFSFIGARDGATVKLRDYGLSLEIYTYETSEQAQAMTMVAPQGTDAFVHRNALLMVHPGGTVAKQAILADLASDSWHADSATIAKVRSVQDRERVAAEARAEREAAWHAARADKAAQDADRQRLSGLYRTAITSKIRREWNKQGGLENVNCVISVRQTSGGSVSDVNVETCDESSPAAAESVARAVRSASPLPMAPDPSVFDPMLRLRFTAGTDPG